MLNGCDLFLLGIIFSRVHYGLWGQCGLCKVYIIEIVLYKYAYFEKYTVSSTFETFSSYLVQLRPKVLSSYGPLCTACSFSEKTLQFRAAISIFLTKDAPPPPR